MSTNLIGWIYKTILIYISFYAIAAAEEMPTTLEELEKVEAVQLVDDNAASDQVTSGSVLNQFNLHILHTKFSCMKAVGHEEFCHCISENMPADQEFANYVVAVSKTKADLKFDELSDYYKQAIDLARSARDKCVTETM